VATNVSDEPTAFISSPKKEVIRSSVMSVINYRTKESVKQNDKHLRRRKNLKFHENHACL
jgi:hypothetical protein